METEEINEILDCLEDSRTLFHYYPDRYAVYLLERYVAENGDAPIKELRKGRYGKLLNRPCLKGLIKQLGDGHLTSESLANLWPAQTQAYALTLGSWGNKKQYSWSQTSRPGSNLVLQLNLSEHWSRKIQLLLDEKLNEYIGRFHPLSNKRDATLAWARLDIDMTSGTVLIEEIQSDLINILQNFKKLAETAIENSQKTVVLSKTKEPVSSQKLFRLTQDLLKETKDIWAEAMLTAAIWFSLEELGMSKIYFHTFETGCVLKGLSWSKPPRSLYTQVPKKFCFDKTEQGPSFVINNRQARRRLKNNKHTHWFVKAA